MGIGFVFVVHNTTSKMLLRSCNCNFFAAIIAVTILLIGVDGLALSSPSTTHDRLVGYNRYNNRRLVLYATSIDDDEQVREDDDLQITDIISRDDDSESSSSSTNIEHMTYHISYISHVPYITYRIPYTTCHMSHITYNHNT